MQARLLAEPQLAYERLRVDVVTSLPGSDALIDCLVERSALVVVEIVFHRLQIHDLTLRQVRWLVEHETTVVYVGAKRLHGLIVVLLSMRGYATHAACRHDRRENRLSGAANWPRGRPSVNVEQ